jgi:hypothetical protein
MLTCTSWRSWLGRAGLYAADSTCTVWPSLITPLKTLLKARKTSCVGSRGPGSPAQTAHDHEECAPSMTQFCACLHAAPYHLLQFRYHLKG